MRRRNRHQLAAQQTADDDVSSLIRMKRLVAGSPVKQARLRDESVREERAAILTFAPHLAHPLDAAIASIRADGESHRAAAAELSAREDVLVTELHRRTDVLHTGESVRAFLMFVCILCAVVTPVVWLAALGDGGSDVWGPAWTSYILGGLSVLALLGDVIVARHVPPSTARRTGRMHAGLAAGHLVPAALGWFTASAQNEPVTALTVAITHAIVAAAHLIARALNAPGEARAQRLHDALSELHEQRRALEARETALVANARARIDEVVAGLDRSRIEQIRRETHRRLARRNTVLSRTLMTISARLGIPTELDETPPRIGDAIIDALVTPAP